MEPGCAKSALSEAITTVGTSCQATDYLTVEPSCVCKSTGNLSSAITSDVQYSCGTSDDAYVTSAAQVLDLYCDFEDSVNFVTTWAKEADSPPWEMEEIGYLPGCASEAVSDIVSANDYVYARCPSSSGLRRECMCSRTNVISRVKSEIADAMDSYCDSGDDVPMAEGLMDGYCRRVLSGSNAEYPTPTGPAGDMTYYIDAMPQYRSISACAQLGLSSAVFHKTSYVCPTGAQGLASCVCFKPVVSAWITSTLSEVVPEECSDDRQGLSEAIDAFNFYCSAAKGDEIVTVEQSITETFPLLRPSDGVRTDPTNTATCEEDSEQDRCEGGSDTNQKGIIAGAVIGGVFFIAMLIGIGWFIRRRKRRAGTGQPPATQEGRVLVNPACKGCKPEELNSEDAGRPVSELPNVTQPCEMYVERSEWGHSLQGGQK